jgi:hypothetical protein
MKSVSNNTTVVHYKFETKPHRYLLTKKYIK